MEQQTFNTVAIINIIAYEGINDKDTARKAVEALHDNYTVAIEILHDLVLDHNIIEDSIQIVPMLAFMEMFNDEDFDTDYTVIGFTNLQEEVA